MTHHKEITNISNKGEEVTMMDSVKKALANKMITESGHQ